MRTIEQGCADYIALLERTSPLAPYNMTHHVLRGLYYTYGKSAVDAECDRQFNTPRGWALAEGSSPEKTGTEGGSA
jgi:hypothetical protein